MAYKIGVGNIDIHGAGAGALSALPALLRITPDAEDAEHAEEPHARAAGAEIVAEGAVDEKRNDEEEDDDTRGDGDPIAAHEQGEISWSLKQGDADPHGEKQVETIAGQLQVTLRRLWYTQPGKMEKAAEFCHPFLCCAEGADPSAEEDTDQQDGGQQHGVYFLGCGNEVQTQYEAAHENQLYDESQNLNFVKFLMHVPIL